MTQIVHYREKKSYKIKPNTIVKILTDLNILFKQSLTYNKMTFYYAVQM